MKILLILLAVASQNVIADYAPVSSRGTRLYAKNEKIYSDYYWIDSGGSRDLKMSVCSEGICQSIIDPPLLEHLIIHPNYNFVIGLTKIKWNEQGQVFLWDENGKIIYTRRVNCGDKDIFYCDESATNFIFWFDGDFFDYKLSSENNFLYLSLPSAPSIDCFSEIHSEGRTQYSKDCLNKRKFFKIKLIHDLIDYKTDALPNG